MSNSLDLATIVLPEEIKLKLEVLGNVESFTLNPWNYIDLDDDVRLDLNKIFDIHSQVEYINVIFERIITQVFGGHEIIIINPKCKIYKNAQKIEIYLQGLLNNQNIELVFSKNPILKYQLNHEFSFSNLTNAVPIISNLNLDEAVLIISNNSHNYLHKELGNINLNKGLNFIGNINLQTISKNLSKFIYEYLQIRDLAGLISINSTGKICLISHIAGQRNLFSQPPLQVDFNNLLLELNIDPDLQVLTL